MFDIPYFIVDKHDRVIAVCPIKGFDHFDEVEAKADVHAKVRGERVYIASGICNGRGEVIGHERVGIAADPA